MDELLGVMTAAEADFSLPSFFGSADAADDSRRRFFDSEFFFGAKNEVIMMVLAV